jgi:hypothetical protein
MFVLGSDNFPDTPEEIGRVWDAYREYLHSIQDKLPPGVYEFASAEWHYSFQDSRSLHDARVESIVIEEQSPIEDYYARRLNIKVLLLGPYDDGNILLTYQGVHSYSMQKRRKEFGAQAPGQGHGDWLVDEIRLSESGLILHEIELVLGTWLIECEDLQYEWQPFA